MFCYGKKNVINFNNMQGIIGLVASNGSGKSSVFDIILYCNYFALIFDSLASTI